MAEQSMLKHSRKALAAAALFLAGSILVFFVSISRNQGYFTEIAYDNTALYQWKQVFALLVLFLWGYFFLSGIQKSMNPVSLVLFAFPTGICLWVFVSFLLLLTGSPYTFALTCTLVSLSVFLALALPFRTQRQGFLIRLRENLTCSLPALLAVLGCVFLASTGLIYKFVSYDSYFYFTNYGHTLAVVGNFKDLVGDNSFTLTNISQFLPILNAYTSFWGLDQCFQAQALLSANIVACFFYGLYRHASVSLLATKKKALLYSGLLTLFLVSSTSFIIASTWVLANMYCMAYLFFVILLHDWKEPLPEGKNSDCLIVTALFLTALTLLRKDGIIFVCFLMACLALKKLYDRKTLFLLFLPSIIAELCWLFYVRVVLKATVMQAAFTSIANNKNVALAVGAILAVCIYILLLHPVFEKRLPFPEVYLLYGGMLLLLALLTIRDWNQVVDNIDMTIRNMFLFPSSWGISALFFAVLLVLTLSQDFLKDTDTFIWLGYTILNFISYCSAGKYLWVNWDDSYNRILLQIIPVFLFVCGKKLFSQLSVRAGR